MYFSWATATASMLYASASRSAHLGSIPASNCLLKVVAQSRATAIEYTGNAPRLRLKINLLPAIRRRKCQTGLPLTNSTKRPGVSKSNNLPDLRLSMLVGVKVFVRVIFSIPDRPRNLTKLGHKLGHKCQRQWSGCLAAFSLVAEAADVRGRAGPFIACGYAQMILRDWLCTLVRHCRY